MENDRISTLEKENACIKRNNAKLQARLLTYETKRTDDIFNGQLNLHFLFNTLNFIYNKTAKDKPDLADVVLSLSDVMRYTITPSNASRFAKLSEEVEHAEKLVSLYNLRMGGKECIRISKNGTFDDIQFPAPLLLILLDNIFKYGKLTPETPAEIFIYSEGKMLKVRANHARNLHSVYSKEKKKEMFQSIRKNLRWGYRGSATFRQWNEKDFQRFEIVVDLGMPIIKRAS